MSRYVDMDKQVADAAIRILCDGDGHVERNMWTVGDVERLAAVAVRAEGGAVNA